MIVSHTNQVMSAHRRNDDAAERGLARRTTESLAETVRDLPDRFGAFGTLALLDADRTVVERTTRSRRSSSTASPDPIAHALGLPPTAYLR